MAEPILVADIGGTNARFAVAERAGDGVRLDHQQTLDASAYPTLAQAARVYWEGLAVRPKRACFAAAGPLIGGAVQFTNSRWVLRADDIAGPLALDAFRIVNDFFALAAGIAHLKDESWVEIKSGERDPNAPQLVIGPGTGLGQALIVPTPGGRKIVSTEGGHIAFAAQTPDEMIVKAHIARAHERVSVERLLSGEGLMNIYCALAGDAGEQPQFEKPAQITSAALDGGDALAVRTVDVFCRVLGRVAGDGVLSAGARGGVVLAGGILPKIKPLFLNSGFVECFCDKGRMQDYVAQAPVRLVVDGAAALYGAAAALAEGA